MSKSITDYVLDAAERWSNNIASDASAKLWEEVSKLPVEHYNLREHVASQYPTDEMFEQSARDSRASGSEPLPQNVSWSIKGAPFAAKPSAAAVSYNEIDRIVFSTDPTDFILAHEESHQSDKNFARASGETFVDYLVSPAEVRADWTLSVRAAKIAMYQKNGTVPLDPKEIRDWGIGLLDSIRDGGAIDEYFLPKDRQLNIQKLSPEDYERYKASLYEVLPSITQMKTAQEFVS